ncbi:MAG: inositol monophosphatase [Candidatus Didemnitutus sp.]|nr:inositol monophosphatase [Candidatus Didemnitutus sp.]
MQDEIRVTVTAARRQGAAKLSRVAGVTSADTIYGVDRISERVVLAWLEKHWPRAWALEVVMEGIADGEVVTFPHGTSVAQTQWKLILDPIDGTRGLMYDKRSAWSLAALAPQRGARNTLADIQVAAMTELPTSKLGVVDQLSAVRGVGVKATRLVLHSSRRQALRLAPSTAKDVTHGFASFAKFLPEGKAWLAEREEGLWQKLGWSGAKGGQPIFDDQYISTGGQLYELLMGHDRFVADLRPFAYAQLGLGESTPLACHPYDICTALIAQEAGCVVVGADGKPLRAPLDTTTSVAWVGYANKALARKIGPALREVLELDSC